MLRQYSVDVGDRRVLAGVHYPSDNLGSWTTALLLATCVCNGDTAGRAMLWQAISTQSVVYSAISAASGPAAAAYAPVLGLLNWLGQDPTRDIDAALEYVRNLPLRDQAGKGADDQLPAG
jgi:hypothetical protein